MFNSYPVLETTPTLELLLEKSCLGLHSLGLITETPRSMLSRPYLWNAGVFTQNGTVKLSAVGHRDPQNH